jgi:outer membrane protein insertion porin family
MAGALFGITRPLPTVTFTQKTDSSGTPLFNSDGSPTLLPNNIPQFTTVNGQQVPIYQVPTTDATNGGKQTTCQVGYSDTAGGACAGTSVNAQYSLPQAPFFEQFVGDTAKPRVSIGIGVNWNSPFGPLRIDLAKTLLKAKGDDTKLFTFNVGTSFQ